jgi:hypothetical protein
MANDDHVAFLKQRVTAWNGWPEKRQVVDVDLVGQGQHLRGDVEAQRLSGIEVDHQLEFGRLRDWQIGRLGTFQDFAGVDTRLTIGITNAGAITHQATCRCHFAQMVHRGHRKDAASSSLSVLAFTISNFRPSVSAAACMSLVSIAEAGLVGSTRKPITIAAGTSQEIALA